jgi:hypothetical protein
MCAGLLLLCAAFAGFAFACGGNKKTGLPQLSVPGNVVVDRVEEKLTWTAVESANGYVVSAAGGGGFLEEYAVTAASYSLAELANGAYTLKVKAVGDGVSYSDSDWSEGVPYTAGKVLVKKFEVDSSLQYCEIGEICAIDPVSAEGDDGIFYPATVSVTAPGGAAVETSPAAGDKRTFAPAVLGDYTVTYTVPIGENGSTAKSYQLNVYDETAPQLSADFAEKNITAVGTVLDISGITVTDNSGESITPVVTAHFKKPDGTTEDEAPDNDGKITLSKEGAYTVNVKATDSSGNETDTDVIVWTKMTFEDGLAPDNEFFATEISDEVAHGGAHSNSVDIFAAQTTWHAGEAMLGDNVQILNYSDYDKLSFWFSYTLPDGVDAVLLLKEDPDPAYFGVYYDTAVYDLYGDAVAKKRTGGANSTDYYEFKADTWYRWVVDLEPNELGATSGKAPIRNLLQYDLKMSFWVNSGEFGVNRSTVYIDDVRVFNSDDDGEQYADKPAPPPDASPMMGYTKGTDHGRVGDRLIDLYAPFVAANYDWVTSNAYVDYKFFKGTSESPVALSAADTGDSGIYNGWQIRAGNNGRSFIYAVQAKADVVVEFIKCFENNADADIMGWYTHKTLKAYRDNGVAKTQIYEEFTGETGNTDESNKTKYYPSFTVLNGQTLYFEISCEAGELETMGQPPSFKVYAAVAPSA